MAATPPNSTPDVLSITGAQVYRKLQYFVPMPGKNKKDESGKKARLELLKGISGAAVPGQLTALMGGSGAGKVTQYITCAVSSPNVASLDCRFASLKSLLRIRCKIMLQLLQAM